MADKKVKTSIDRADEKAKKEVPKNEISLDELQSDIDAYQPPTEAPIEIQDRPAQTFSDELTGQTASIPTNPRRQLISQFLSERDQRKGITSDQREKRQRILSNILGIGGVISSAIGEGLTGRSSSPTYDKILSAMKTLPERQAGSAVSGRGRELFSRLFPDIDFNNQSLADMERLYPYMKHEKPLDILREQRIEKGKLSIEKAKRDLEKQDGLKELKPADVKYLNSGNAIPDTLSNLFELMEKNKNEFGVIRGKVGENNPLNREAQELNSAIRIARQVFGTYIEGGKLIGADEKKYEKMFPKLGDSYKVAKDKLRLASDMLSREHKNRS